MSLVKPPLLKVGDKVSIVAPAGIVEQSYIEDTTEILTNWGLEVVLGEHIYSQHHQFAGSDAQRSGDLQKVLDSDEIKAVFCARGGYGTLRILDSLNWHLYTESPKWIIGFSDITALHATIYNHGIQCVHGIMPVNFNGLDVDSEPIKMLHQTLFSGALKYILEPHSLNTFGTEKAQLIGGNLTLLTALSGTPFDFNWDDKILFIEEVGEHYYHLDRMLQGIRLSGKLDKLNGILVGGLSDMKDNKRPFGRNPEEIIADMMREFDIPVAFGFPAGHIKRNLPLIFGAEVSLEVNALGAEIKF